MVKCLQTVLPSLYWSFGLIVIAVDLTRCVCNEYWPLLSRPICLPGALACLGLRAVAGLLIVGGLYEILSCMLSGLIGKGKANEADDVPALSKHMPHTARPISECEESSWGNSATHKTS